MHRLFHLFPTYLARWCAFGFIAGMIGAPVLGGDGVDFWSAKMAQAAFGLLFGAACAVVFAPLQNAVNSPRKRWLSWLVVIGVWMGMKFAFFALFTGFPK